MITFELLHSAFCSVNEKLFSIFNIQQQQQPKKSCNNVKTGNFRSPFHWGTSEPRLIRCVAHCFCRCRMFWLHSTLAMASRRRTSSQHEQQICTSLPVSGWLSVGWESKERKKTIKWFIWTHHEDSHEDDGVYMRCKKIINLHSLYGENGMNRLKTHSQQQKQNFF